MRDVVRAGFFSAGWRFRCAFWQVFGEIECRLPAAPNLPYSGWFCNLPSPVETNGHNTVVPITTNPAKNNALSQGRGRVPSRLSAGFRLRSHPQPARNYLWKLHPKLGVEIGNLYNQGRPSPRLLSCQRPGAGEADPNRTLLQHQQQRHFSPTRCFSPTPISRAVADFPIPFPALGQHGMGGRQNRPDHLASPELRSPPFSAPWRPPRPRELYIVTGPRPFAANRATAGPSAQFSQRRKTRRASFQGLQQFATFRPMGLPACTGKRNGPPYALASNYAGTLEQRLLNGVTLTTQLSPANNPLPHSSGRPWPQQLKCAARAPAFSRQIFPSASFGPASELTESQWPRKNQLAAAAQPGKWPRSYQQL